MDLREVLADELSKSIPTPHAEFLTPLIVARLREPDVLDEFERRFTVAWYEWLGDEGDVEMGAGNASTIARDLLSDMLGGGS